MSLLLGAERPVLVTEHAGRDPKAVGALVELCEAMGIPVMESYRPAFLNFPRNHPLYLPFDPRRVADSDLVLVVDAVSPWYPLNNGPKPSAKVASSETSTRIRVYLSGDTRSTWPWSLRPPTVSRRLSAGSGLRKRLPRAGPNTKRDFRKSGNSTKLSLPR